jgi:unsaturated rhamnogalacturonyl hydrolase
MPIQTRFMVAAVVIMVVACNGPAARQDAAFMASAQSARLVYLPQLISQNTRPRLTTDTQPGRESQPSYSPDGRKVVYVHTAPDGATDIYLVPSSQGAPVNLTQTPNVLEDTPRFSPDGARIIFSRKTPTETWDIYQIGVDGSGLTFYTGTGSSNELHAFPTNNESVLFTSDLNGNFDVYRTAGPGPLTAWESVLTSPDIDRFPSFSPDGLTLLFRSERSGASDIYTATASAPARPPSLVVAHPAFDGYPNFVPDSSGILFDSTRTGLLQSHLTNPAGMNVRSLAQADDAVVRDVAVSPDSRWQIFAAGPTVTETRLYLQAFESPLFQIGARGRALLQPGKCDWEAQTLAMAWVMAFKTTGDLRYMDWIRAFVDACKPVRGAYEINDGLIGFASLAVYSQTQQIEYLDYARSIGDWMLSRASRARDGTLFHLEDSDTVWDDTLLGVAPLLTELTRVTGEVRYRDFAARQAILHATHLQDPTTGLYRHAWSESLNRHIGPVFWARGNGWVAFGNALILASQLPAPVEVILRPLADKQLGGLAAAQQSGGRWRTVLNSPTAYIESSSGGLITFALTLHRVCNTGSPVYGEQATRGYHGIWGQIAPDGTLKDVQVPTGPLGTDAEYLRLPKTEPQLYGQAVGVLNALRTPQAICHTAVVP